MTTKEKLTVFSNWDSHIPLEGMIVSLEQLVEIVPEHTVKGDIIKKATFGKDKIHPGYDVYGRTNSQTKDAHGCPICQKIIVGPPIFRAYNDFRGPRAGDSGYEIKCANNECNAVLAKHVVKVY